MMEPADWVYADSHKGRCDFCKQSKTVAYLDDPYILELYNEHRELYICHDCYLDRLYACDE
jgi:hypothetical protein